MASDPQVLEVQKFLRSIGMNMGAQNGEADAQFKAGALEALTILHRAVTKDPTKEITDFSPATMKMLREEIAEFKQGDQYKALNGLLQRTGNNSTAAKTLVELGGSAEEKGAFKYYNWSPANQAAGTLVEKPAHIQNSTAEVMNVINNSDQIFSNLEKIYPPEPAKPAINEKKADTTPKPDPLPKLDPVTGRVIPLDPAKTNEVFEGMKTPAGAEPPKTVEEAANIVEKFLYGIGSAINNQVQDPKNPLPFKMNIPLPDGSKLEDGIMDDQSQRSLQSVMQVMRARLGIPGGDTWRYDASVGQQMLQKLPSLKSSLQPDQQEVLDNIIKNGKDKEFVQALDLLQKEGKLSDHMMVSNSPVQLTGIHSMLLGWLVKFVASIFPQALPFMDELARAHTGFGINDLLPNNDQSKAFADGRKNLTDDPNTNLANRFKESLVGVTDFDHYMKSMKTMQGTLSLLPFGDESRRAGFKSAVDAGLDAAKKVFGDTKAGTPEFNARIDAAAKAYANTTISEMNQIKNFGDRRIQTSEELRKENPRLDVGGLIAFEKESGLKSQKVIDLYNELDKLNGNDREALVFKNESNGKIYIANLVDARFMIKELPVEAILADMKGIQLEQGGTEQANALGKQKNAQLDAALEAKYEGYNLMPKLGLNDRYEMLRDNENPPTVGDISKFVSENAAKPAVAATVAPPAPTPTVVDPGARRAARADLLTPDVRTSFNTSAGVIYDSSMMKQLKGHPIILHDHDAKTTSLIYLNRDNGKAYGPVDITKEMDGSAEPRLLRELDRHYDKFKGEDGVRKFITEEVQKIPDDKISGFVFDSKMMGRLQKEPVIGYDRTTKTVTATYVNKETGQAYGPIDITAELKGTVAPTTLRELDSNYDKLKGEQGVRKFINGEVKDILDDTVPKGSGSHWWNKINVGGYDYRSNLPMHAYERRTPDLLKADSRDRAIDKEADEVTGQSVHKGRDAVPIYTAPTSDAPLPGPQ